MNKGSFLSVVIVTMLLVTPVGALFEMDGYISGNLTTSDGTALSGYIVTAKKTAGGDEFTTTTDSSGNFAIEAPPGMYEIAYTHNGKTHTYGRVVVANGFTASINMQVSADANVTSESFDNIDLIPELLDIKAPILADAGEEVSIKVIDKITGDPVNDSDVYIGDRSISVDKKNASLVIKYGELIGRTDENGDITHIFNESGKYLIAATREGYISDLEDIRIKYTEITANSGNIGFNTDKNCIFEYSVNGTEFFSSVDVDGNIYTGEKTGVKSRFETEKLRISAHDNANGLLKFKAEESTNVSIELSESATIEKESDKKIAVISNGTEGTLMISGQGHLSVEGDIITVELKKNSQLIFKTYPGEKDSGDEEIEDGIISGSLSAEIQVLGDGAVTDSVEYSSDVEIKSVSVTEDDITVTVDSATEISKTIVITIDNNELPADPGKLSVKVDGEATVKASSIDELYATETSDISKSMVIEGETETKVFVAVNHFSERSVTIEEVNSATGETPETTSTETQTYTPGFEAVFAIPGLLAIAYLLRKGT